MSGNEQCNTLFWLINKKKKLKSAVINKTEKQSTESENFTGKKSSVHIVHK